MGRPLKIQKVIATGNPGVDIGFNAFNTLINPVPPTGAINTDQFVGVVGGSNTVDTAAYPTVKCRVFIEGQGSESDGYIIRQKGAHKYLVASTTSVNDEDLVVGNAYRITSLGTTDWQACGAPVGAAVGAIFTCTADAGAGTGTANLVGVCVLSSEADAALTEGNMNITYSLGDSTATNISKLTNKFLQNFAGGATGGNADTGDVWAATDTIDNVEYVANFFTDEGTMLKSGAESDTWGVNGSDQNAGGTLDVAIVENYNS